MLRSAMPCVLVLLFVGCSHRKTEPVQTFNTVLVKQQTDEWNEFAAKITSQVKQISENAMQNPNVVTKQQYVCNETKEWLQSLVNINANNFGLMNLSANEVSHRTQNDNNNVSFNVFSNIVFTEAVSFVWANYPSLIETDESRVAAYMAYALIDGLRNTCGLSYPLAVAEMAKQRTRQYAKSIEVKKITTWSTVKQEIEKQMSSAIRVFLLQNKGKEKPICDAFASANSHNRTIFDNARSNYEITTIQMLLSVVSNKASNEMPDPEVKTAFSQIYGTVVSGAINMAWKDFVDFAKKDQTSMSRVIVESLIKSTTDVCGEFVVASNKSGRRRAVTTDVITSVAE